jgi:hypothetical protein
MPYSFLNLSFLDNEEENQESLVLKLGAMAMTSQHIDGMTLCKHSVNLYFIKFNSRDFYMMSKILQFWVVMG